MPSSVRRSAFPLIAERRFSAINGSYNCAGATIGLSDEAGDNGAVLHAGNSVQLMILWILK